MMSWVYDKRPVNGAALVYHGVLLVPSDSLEAMMTESGPCLVERNCRAHDADGIGMPRVRALIGGFPGGCRSRCLPQCGELQEASRQATFAIRGNRAVSVLVSFTEGKVKGTSGYDKIEQLPSCISLVDSVEDVQKIERTGD